MSNDECGKKNDVGCVQKKAYELWERDGHKHGRELHYWLEAEKTVMNQIKEVTAPITEQKRRFKNNMPQEKRNGMYQGESL